MTTSRMSIIGTIGSVFALALTFCCYPIQLFGTGLIAQVAWFSGLIMAIAFGLILLGAIAWASFATFKMKSSRRELLLPTIPLTLAGLSWWHFLDFLSRME